MTSTLDEQMGPPPEAGDFRMYPVGSREWLHQLHAHACARALALLKKKNADYAGNAPDVFGNLNACEALGVRSEIGMLIRSMDKLVRLSNVIGSGKNHVGDPIEGECLDIINYAVLLLARVQARAHKEVPHAGPDPNGR